MCIIAFLWIVFWYAHKRKRKRKFSQYWLIGDFWAVMEKLGGQFSVFFPLFFIFDDKKLHEYHRLGIKGQYYNSDDEKNTRDQALLWKRLNKI